MRLYRLVVQTLDDGVHPVMGKKAAAQAAGNALTAQPVRNLSQVLGRAKFFFAVPEIHGVYNSSFLMKFSALSNLTYAFYLF
jgi:hypothetical protein